MRLISEFIFSTFVLNVRNVYLVIFLMITITITVELFFRFFTVLVSNIFLSLPILLQIKHLFEKWLHMVEAKCDAFKYFIYQFKKVLDDMDLSTLIKNIFFLLLNWQKTAKGVCNRFSRNFCKIIQAELLLANFKFKIYTFYAHIAMLITLTKKKTEEKQNLS